MTNQYVKYEDFVINGFWRKLAETILEFKVTLNFDPDISETKYPSSSKGGIISVINIPKPSFSEDNQRDTDGWKVYFEKGAWYFGMTQDLGMPNTCTKSI